MNLFKFLQLFFSKVITIDEINSFRGIVSEEDGTLKMITKVASSGIDVLVAARFLQINDGIIFTYDFGYNGFSIIFRHGEDQYRIRYDALKLYCGNITYDGVTVLFDDEVESQVDIFNISDDMILGLSLMSVGGINLPDFFQKYIQKFL